MHQLHQSWEWPNYRGSYTVAVSELFLQELLVNLQVLLLHLETAVEWEDDSEDEKLRKSKCIVLNSVKYAIEDIFILDPVHAEEITLFAPWLNFGQTGFLLENFS